ncbi:MAG: CFI-box-CTERM domain-containing protein [Candidatus Anammoxibacter sp.]
MNEEWEDPNKLFCLASSIIPKDKEGLLALRNFRDNFLSNSITGLGLVKLYYDHSPEVIDILNLNPDLKSKATETLKNLVEALKVISSSDDSPVNDLVKDSIPTWLENDVNSLLNELVELSNDELKDAINKARKSLYE